MNKYSDELNIEKVNEALSKVQGLSFELPSDVVKKIGVKDGGCVQTFDPKELQVEETNNLVRNITQRRSLPKEEVKEDIELHQKVLIETLKKYIQKLQKESGDKPDAKRLVDKLNDLIKELEAVKK